MKTLPSLTTVWSWRSCLQGVEQIHAVPGRVVGDDLRLALGTAVAALQVEPELLLAVVYLRAFDVVC